MQANQFTVGTLFLPFNTTRGRQARFFTALGQAEKLAIAEAGQGQDGFVGSRTLSQEGFGTIVALAFPAAVKHLLENLARLPGVMASALQTVAPEEAKTTLLQQIQDLKNTVTGDDVFMLAVERASLDRNGEESPEDLPSAGRLN